MCVWVAPPEWARLRPRRACACACTCECACACECEWAYGLMPRLACAKDECLRARARLGVVCPLCLRAEVAERA